MRLVVRLLGLSAVAGALYWLSGCTYEFCPDCKAEVKLCVDVTLPFDGGFTDCPEAGGAGSGD